jgi:hypothetical protein
MLAGIPDSPSQQVLLSLNLEEKLTVMESDKR